MSRLRREDGYSLIEMLMVMSMMALVMGGVTSLFIAGSNAEVDLNRRFQAQQGARVALDRIRREIHCADGATTTPSSGAASQVTLNLPGYCKYAVNASPTSISWCTVSAGTNRYALYRKVASSCDATGTKLADYLTQQSIFELRGSDSNTKTMLRVNIPVDVKVGDATPVYALCDHIVMRNTLRTTGTLTPLTAC